jgi:hypothetical protein
MPSEKVIAEEPTREEECSKRRGEDLKQISVLLVCRQLDRGRVDQGGTTVTVTRGCSLFWVKLRAIVEELLAVLESGA